MNRSDAVERSNPMHDTDRSGRNGGILYPLLLVAAIAVIVFSIIGIATLTGLMPNASSTNDSSASSDPAVKKEQSRNGPTRKDLPRNEPAAKPRAATNRASGVECFECGAVESIRVVAAG